MHVASAPRKFLSSRGRYEDTEINIDATSRNKGGFCADGEDGGEREKDDGNKRGAHSRVRDLYFLSYHF